MVSLMAWLYMFDKWSIHTPFVEYVEPSQNKTPRIARSSESHNIDYAEYTAPCNPRGIMLTTVVISGWKYAR